MRGQVSSILEAEITIRVFGPTGTFLDLTAVIDTGFSGQLSLPELVVSALGLNWLYSSAAFLADGSRIDTEVYEVEIDWFGQSRFVDVSAVGTEALIGMVLLEDSELRIEIRAGGEVELKLLGTSGVSP